MKDFDTWNEKKKNIHCLDSYCPFYRERQIRWCRLGTNIGSEQDGVGKEFSRPVLIIKAFNRQVCLIVPLTTAQKKGKYYVALGLVGDKKATAIISQIRLIDTRRLDTHIDTLTSETFAYIRNTVKALL